MAVDRVEFDKILDWMKVNGLIKPRAMGEIYELRATGIVEAERRGIVSEELARKNKEVRALILTSLTDAYNKQGPHASVHYEQIARSYQLTHNTVLSNLDVLENEYYYVEKDSALGRYKLTYHGLAFSEKCQQLKATIERFEKLTQMAPQPRGRAFQKFFAELLAKNGWDQAEGVRTSHEEMDIIISRDREYYLIECKWEKNTAR